MHKTLLTILLLGNTTLSLAQKEASTAPTISLIDALDTTVAVQAFIKQLDRRHRSFKLNKITDLTVAHNYGGSLDEAFCQTTAARLQINQAYEKADFDGNGLTDILLLGQFYGINALIVLDMGANGFTYHTLGSIHQAGCIYPKFIDHNGQPLVELTYQKRLTYREHNQKKYDPETFYATRTDNELLTQLLIFNGGKLVEYNPDPINHDIESIKFATNGCYGSCPVFTMTVFASQEVHLEAIKFNQQYDETGKVMDAEMEGDFEAYLDLENFQQLMDQVNYLNFTAHKNSYSIEATDMASATLTIIYDHGKVKSIHDYGAQGTWGLKALYKTLVQMKRDLLWQRQPDSGPT